MCFFLAIWLPPILLISNWYSRVFLQFLLDFWVSCATHSEKLHTSISEVCKSLLWFFCYRITRLFYFRDFSLSFWFSLEAVMPSKFFLLSVWSPKGFPFRCVHLTRVYFYFPRISENFLLSLSLFGVSEGLSPLHAVFHENFLFRYVYFREFSPLVMSVGCLWRILSPSCWFFTKLLSSVMFSSRKVFVSPFGDLRWCSLWTRFSVIRSI